MDAGRQYQHDETVPNLSALRRPSVGKVLGVLRAVAACGHEVSGWQAVVQAAAVRGLLTDKEARLAICLEREAAYFSQEWARLVEQGA